MADNVIDSLTINLNFDTRQFQESAKKVQDIISDFSNKASTTLSTIFDAFALKAGLDFGKNIAEGAANAGSQLIFMSDKLGESVETLGAWGQAARRNGGDIATVFSNLSNFQSSILSAAKGGNPTLLGTLFSLGIPKTEIIDQTGHLKRYSDILFTIGDRLRGRADQQWYAQQLGISNPLLRVITEGKSREETEKYIESMKRLGVVTRAQAEADLALKIKLEDLNQVWDMQKQKLAIALMPALIQFSNWIIKVSQQDLPVMINQLHSFEHSLGITDTTLIKVAGAFALLTGVSVMINGIAAAMVALRVAAIAILGPLGAVATAAYGLYETYSLYDEYKKIKNPKIGFPEFAAERAVKSFSDTSQRLFGHNTESIPGYASNDALKQAQAVKESGGQSVVGYKLARGIDNKFHAVLDNMGNKIAEAFGVFQIKPSTASEVLGRSVSPSELLNPNFNEKIRDRIWQMALKKSGGDTLGALAYYNGGQADLDYYKRTGHTFNNYGESISNMASKIGQSASSRSAAPVSPITNNKQASYNIHSLNLHGVTDPQSFSQALQDATQAAWSWSSGVLA